MIQEVKSEAETRAFGELIGSRLKGGELIVLVGDVGAGKTTFTKGLAKGLLIDEDIQSPSFTISRNYEARDGIVLAHYDFYRLNDAGIMANELHESIHDPAMVTIIEWADIVEGVLSEDRMTIVFEPKSENERTLTVTGAKDLL